MTPPDTIPRTWQGLASLLLDLADGLSEIKVPQTARAQVTGYFLMRAMRRTKALEVLFDSGLSAEALVLVRAAFEDWISLSYILLEPGENRAREFFEDEDKLFASLFGALSSEVGEERAHVFFGPIPPAVRPHIGKRSRELKAFGGRKRHELAEDVGLGGDFVRFVYGYLSELAHGSIKAREDLVISTNEGHRLRPLTPDPELEARLGQWAFWFHLRVVTRACMEIGGKDVEPLSDSIIALGRQHPENTWHTLVLRRERCPEAGAADPTPALLPATGEDARNRVKAFAESFVHLKMVHATYGQLFVASDGAALAGKSAPDFFHLVNRLLIGELILSCCTVTDPPETAGKQNLSVRWLTERIEWPESTRERLRALQDALRPLRGSLVEARNKLVAHHEIVAFLDDRVLGRFPQGEDRRFFDALEEMTGLMHEASGQGPLGSVSVAAPGDVLDLKRVLLRGVAWDALFQATSNELREQMTECLREVRESLH